MLPEIGKLPHLSRKFLVRMKSQSPILCGDLLLLNSKITGVLD